MGELMMKLFSILSLLASSLFAEDPKPTIEQLQQQLVAKDAQIAKLQAALDEETARRKVGWDYLNLCLERAVIAEKPKPKQ